MSYLKYLLHCEGTCRKKVPDSSSLSHQEELIFFTWNQNWADLLDIIYRWEQELGKLTDPLFTGFTIRNAEVSMAGWVVSALTGSLKTPMGCDRRGCSPSVSPWAAKALPALHFHQNKGSICRMLQRTHPQEVSWVRFFCRGKKPLPENRKCIAVAISLQSSVRNECFMHFGQGLLVCKPSLICRDFILHSDTQKKALYDECNPKYRDLHQMLYIL